MNNIGWGIIGVPNGFQHISQGITANESISRLDDRIRREEYKEENLFAIIYDTAIVGTSNTRQLMTYFVQYNFSKEAEKERPGSFYGSYIALPGRLPSDIKCCEKIVKVLQELSFYNQEIFMEGDKFDKEYSNDYELPPDLEEIVERIVENTTKIELPTEKFDSKKKIVVYANEPSEVFLNSIELYDIYSRIYISNNESYCRHIDEGSDTNYKELSDIVKESFDIVEARRIEQERIEIYKQNLEEKRIREQEQAEREEQERIRVRKEKLEELFQNLEESFFYCGKDAGLDKLIKEYRSGINNDFDALKGLSKRLEGYINFANNIASEIKDKKLELDSEIIKLEGNVYQVNEEVASAVNAAEAASTESYIKPEPRIKPTKVSNNPNIKKPQGIQGITSKNNSQNLIKNIIIGVSLIIIILAIIAAIYFAFLNKDFKPSKPKLEFSTSQNINIDGKDTSAYQDSNENLDTDIEYKEIDFESTMGNSSSSLNYSAECNYDEKNIRYYNITRTDIMEYDRLRFDSEIISKIMESILKKENVGDIYNINKDEFEKMLMDCNDELNYKKYNPSDLGSNTLLTVIEGSKVKYFK